MVLGERFPEQTKNKPNTSAEVAAAADHLCAKAQSRHPLCTNAPLKGHVAQHAPHVLPAPEFTSLNSAACCWRPTKSGLEIWNKKGSKTVVARAQFIELERTVKLFG